MGGSYCCGFAFYGNHSIEFFNVIIDGENMIRKLMALFGFLLVTSTTVAGALVPEWVVEGMDVPESAYFDQSRNVIYVANMVGQDNVKDGVGFISKVSTNGKVITREWITGLDAPKGMAVKGGSLFVTDIDKLIEIDIAAGKIKQT